MIPVRAAHEVLGGLEALGACTPRERRSLLANSERLSVGPGQLIARAGERAREVVVVVSGEVAEVAAASGEQLRAAGAGHVIGAAAVADGTSHPVGVVAVTEVEVVVLDERTYRTALHAARSARRAA